MVRPTQFTRSVSGVLDAAGGLQVDISPTGGDWVIKRNSVFVSSNTAEPTARIYRNSISQAGFVEGSYTGSNDTSDTRIVAQQGDTLSCVWAGGDVGARATWSLTIVQYPAGTAPLE